MTSTRTRFGGLLAATLLAHAAQAAPSPKIDAEASQRAITLLLAASEDVIPADSTCHGIFGGGNPGRMRDLVAMELATFARGDNTLEGGCQTRGSVPALACHVDIAHAFGEDASSATIRFQAVAGRLVASSLDCLLMP